MSMSSFEFDIDEDALLRDDPLLSQTSARNLNSATQPCTTPAHVFYFSPNINPMSVDMFKDKGSDGTIQLIPLSTLEDPSLDFGGLAQFELSSDNRQPLTGAIVNNEQLTREGAWQDESFIQDTDNGMPAVPDYLPASVMEDPLSSTNDGMIALPTLTLNPTTGDIVQSTMNPVVGFQVAAAVGSAPSNTSSEEQSTNSLALASHSSLGRSKSRRMKKTFLHEAPNKDDPIVKRAASAKDYREKKKLEAMKREENLLKEVEELKAKNSALQQKMDANEAVSRQDTVKMVECVASAVKLAGGGDVIVSPRLANKQCVVNLTEVDIQQIVAEANLSRPGKRFKLICDLDDKGNFIAEKID